uniref:Uncharacterized protein n=1 Tax=Ditylenchus dipsaci TaxID=166011 RepID=A0A915EDW8_9BILA
MEMVPLMLKELDDTNRRFYQMVCFRWFKDIKALPLAASPVAGASSKDPNFVSFEEFLSEGQSLKQLIRFLSRTLMDKGTFDDDCEAKLAKYRAEHQHQWRQCPASLEPINLATDNLLRSRSFSAAVAAPPQPSVTRVLNSAASSSTNSSSTFSQSTLGPSTCLTNAPSTSASREPLNLNNELLEEDEEEEGSEANSRQSRAPKRTGTWLSQRRQRAASLKERMNVANSSDAMFIQLGEILVYQFHSTITVEQGRNKKKDAENVHERELKVLIWRHFVQMLVAVLTDRARFPV